MKKTVALFLLCVLCAAPAAAVPAFDAQKVKQCMSALPETVELEGLKEPLEKVKNSLVDYEAAQRGVGYSQRYQNAVCRITVYLYDLSEKKITPAIIEADFVRNLQEVGYVFDKIHKKELKQFHSYEVSMLDTKYLANVAFTNTTTEALMEGDFNNYILKGRATCRQIEGAEAQVNANIALRHLDEVLRVSAAGLEPCLKQKEAKK